MTDLLTLENRIGGIPWQGKHPNHFIENATSVDLLEWLHIKGMSREKLDQLRREQLEKCYCVKNYFDAVVGSRPKNLAQTRREGQRFRNSLDVGNILKDPDEIVKRSFGYTPPINLPSSFSNSPPDFRPQDPVRELLSAVEQAINQKLSTFREEISHQATNTTAKIITEVRP